MPIKLTERQIEKQIVDLLRAHGWRVLRTNIFNGAVIQRQGSIEPGIPDLMARSVGYEHERWDRKLWRVVWIEVKRPGGKVSRSQAKWWTAHPDEEKVLASSVDDVRPLLLRIDAVD